MASNCNKTQQTQQFYINDSTEDTIVDYMSPNASRLDTFSFTALPLKLSISGTNLKV